jgi:hypothetical protein
MPVVQAHLSFASSCNLNQCPCTVSAYFRREVPRAIMKLPALIETALIIHEIEVILQNILK